MCFVFSISWQVLQNFVISLFHLLRYKLFGSILCNIFFFFGMHQQYKLQSIVSWWMGKGNSSSFQCYFKLKKSLYIWLADLFLYSYEAEFVQKLLRDKNKKLAVSFNLTYRYIDDVLSINNHNFHNYVHLIYPEELDIKDTTESDRSASYLDILLNIDSNGRLTTTLYDKEGKHRDTGWHVAQYNKVPLCWVY